MVRDPLMAAFCTTLNDYPTRVSGPRKTYKPFSIPDSDCHVFLQGQGLVQKRCAWPERCDSTLGDLMQAMRADQGSCEVGARNLEFRLFASGPRENGNGNDDAPPTA